MLKTLRLTSLAMAAIAVVGVILTLIFGLRPDQRIRQFLAQESVVEQMREQKQTVTQKDDAISPLVTQAKAFAFRIDPPPPPPPPPPKQTSDAAQTTTATAPPPPPPPPLVTAKFTLVATARYTDFPEKSLALVDLVSEGLKWVRQGEDVGNFRIQEVRDGSIVLYQNGKRSSELSVPPLPQTVKSLLKADAAPVSSGTAEVFGASAAAAEVPPIQPSALMGAAPLPIRRPREPKTAAVPTPETKPQPQPEPPPPPQPQPEQTIQQQKESLDASIRGIKDMMKKPEEGLDPAELAEENKAWMDMLAILEKERKNLDQMKEEPSADREN